MSRISRNPEIHRGAYCIRGTRIPVRSVKRCAQEWSDATILAEFPGLTQADIDAAKAFRRPDNKDAV